MRGLFRRDTSYSRTMVVGVVVVTPILNNHEYHTIREMVSEISKEGQIIYVSHDVQREIHVETDVGCSKLHDIKVSRLLWKSKENFT